jgi:two-component system alkaline phosphatase synthesis response regulator PhoP
MGNKILVVDDEAHIIKLVESRLKSNGHTVITACNGLEGFEKAKAENPDIILLDITMPRMSGKDALMKLKADKQTSSIPVIMLTGRSGAEDIVDCLTKGGAADYIVKPFMATDFLNKINTVLESGKKIPKDSCEKELLKNIEERVKKALDNKKGQ